jgi:hypothetical protein
MTIREVEFEQQGWKFSVNRLFGKIALAITNAANPPQTFMMNCEEAEWRRLCRESCGEQVTLRGFTTDDGRHAVSYHNGLIQIAENIQHGMSSQMRPEDWLASLIKSAGPQWQPGPPTEIGERYGIEFVGGDRMAGTYIQLIRGSLEFCEKTGPITESDIIRIHNSKIARHFRIPEPPKADPVTEPPKWVRVKSMMAHRGVFDPGQTAWGCRDGGGWVIWRDGGTHIAAGFKEDDWKEIWA